MIVLTYETTAREQELIINELRSINRTQENRINIQKQEIERLKKENNILKKNAEHNDKVVDNVNWENMFFKKIISKAIEYISKHTNNGMFGLRSDTNEIEELLYILKGDDKE